MKRTLRFFVLACFAFSLLQFGIEEPNYLALSWAKQGKPLEQSFLTFSYQESRNELEHSFKPWQQTNYSSAGIAWINGGNFRKIDSLTLNKKLYTSKLQLDSSFSLFVDYGDTGLSVVTRTLHIEQMINTARYSPCFLLHYFLKRQIKASSESSAEFAIYKTSLGETEVRIYVRKSNSLVEKITTLSDDELFGDVLTTFSYSDYSNIGQLSIPKKIRIEKINGKVIDEILISGPRVMNNPNTFLSMPVDYKMGEDEKIVPEHESIKYTSNIHFIELKHTDDRVMLVEFKDFVLIAEAPLNSANGELIISEAHKIAPGKPIRYFVFGHYHAHYLGGVRPFVHKGAKIITTSADLDYVTYLVEAPHSIHPDSLQMQPRPLLTMQISDSLVISDGIFSMNIYFIGDRSAHTDDYLIYYFPSEKLLFEDDLIWIKREGATKKAGARQAGLYNAIKSLKLDVATIVQSWPVSDYGVKTILPFADLEKSMEVK